MGDSTLKGRDARTGQFIPVKDARQSAEHDDGRARPEAGQGREVAWPLVAAPAVPDRGAYREVIEVRRHG